MLTNEDATQEEADAVMTELVKATAGTLRKSKREVLKRTDRCSERDDREQ